MTFESGVTYCCYFYIWLPPASYVVFLTTLVKRLAIYYHICEGLKVRKQRPVGLEVRVEKTL